MSLRCSGGLCERGNSSRLRGLLHLDVRKLLHLSSLQILMQVQLSGLMRLMLKHRLLLKKR